MALENIGGKETTERYQRRQRTTSKARRKKTESTVAPTETFGARKEPHSKGARWTGTSGGTQRQVDKHKEPGLGHPGKKEVPAGNRATRTGSSGGQNPETGTTRDEESGHQKETQGLRKEE